MPISNKSSGSKTYRNWWFILYPESASECWKEILSSYHIPTLISPLHDSDVNPGGEVKKPHYHIMFMFDGKKSESQICALVEAVGGVMIEVVNNLRSCARYLCHLDDYDKFQYPKESVLQYGGADYMEIIGLASDKYTAVSEMQDFCNRYDVYSFYALTMYAKEHKPDWNRVLVDHCTIYMKEWLKSKYWSDQEGIKCIFDPLTGEKIFDIVTHEQG